MPKHPSQNLVVVSNRGPWRCQGEKWNRSSGGLVTALDPVLRETGGHWVCAAEPRDELTPDPPDLAYAIREVSLDPATQHAYYDGFANAVLWPVLHGFPTLGGLHGGPWPAYERANRAFAEAALEATRDGGMLWVHDYHLMRVPSLVRSRRPDLPIGWFCHVPWPGVDVFAVLPWRKQLLRGLLAADVIGFHSSRYADHFLDCAQRLGGAEIDRQQRLVRTAERTTRVIVAPIGIPTDEAERLSSQPEVLARQQAISAAVGHRRILLGVDRLDYTKGIPHRLQAYAKLLEESPELRDQTVMIQVVVPSREDVAAYADLRDQLDQLIGHINGEHSRTGQVAVHYLYSSLDPVELYAHYRAADVAVVTPLRDGMNLVAMEYVAARSENDGALVLSEFAGAAEWLDRAYLVNPYDLDGVVAQLRRALGDDDQTHAARMRSLRRVVSALDVHEWAAGFLEALRSRTSGVRAQPTLAPPQPEADKLLATSVR